ncbi:MAG: hypothetical protein PF513_04935 [Tenericutes bacterium]|jgi:ABC-type transport system substrate-binding protein|nr:hypothetical protein [Mycoplasmatota bacterium]
MKKILFGTLIFVGVLLVGLMIVRGEGLSGINHYVGDETTEEPSSNYSWMGQGYGMMGRYNDGDYGYGSCYGYDEEEKPSYEILYNHLSLEDQEKIDVLYAEMLSEYDFSLMTETEKLETIELIKDALVDEILENDYNIGW